LAGIIISSQNVFLAKGQTLFSIAPNHLQNSYHSRQFKAGRGSADKILCAVQRLGPAAKNHNYGMTSTAKLERLIGIIQNQTFKRIEHVSEPREVGIT
jgi:hypothetical protein